jgi:hypothetical protein
MAVYAFGFDGVGDVVPALHALSGDGLVSRIAPIEAADGVSPAHG